MGASDAVLLPTRRVDEKGGSFVVREYHPGDRGALETMYLGFEPKRAAQGLPPDGPDRIRRWLDSVLDAGLHLVVEVEGEVLGHAMLIPVDGDTVELANFLHQSIRNRGIGTALNSLSVALARRDGYRRVWLCVEPSNRAAIRSYEKAGFLMVPGTLFQPELEMEALTEVRRPETGETPQATARDATPARRGKAPGR